MKPCTTHHHACDCREAKLKRLEQAESDWETWYIESIRSFAELENKLAVATETIKEVIRNSHDIIAKKLCSQTLAEIAPTNELLTTTNDSSEGKE